MKKSICFALLALTLPFSCKKEDNPDNTTLLTQHCWVLGGAKVSPAITVSGVTVTDWYALLPFCDRDNVACLLKNGNVYVDEDATKCDPNDPQVVSSGRWWFSAGETAILAVIDGTSDTITSEILELDSEQLQVRQTLDIFGGPHEVTFNYKPQ